MAVIYLVALTFLLFQVGLSISYPKKKKKKLQSPYLSSYDFSPFEILHHLPVVLLYLDGNVTIFHFPEAR